MLRKGGQTCAFTGGVIHDGARMNRLALGAQLHAVVRASGAGQARAGQKDGAGIGGRAEQGLHQFFGIDDAGLGRPQGRNPRHRRLVAIDKGAIDDLEALDAVGVAALLQAFQLLDLAGIMRDDQLAAFLVRHAVPCAELVERVPAFHGEPGLQRPGGIINAGVDDAAVVGARVEARPPVPLEDADRETTPRHRPRRRQAGHSGANYRDVNLLHASSTGQVGRVLLPHPPYPPFMIDIQSPRNPCA